MIISKKKTVCKVLALFQIKHVSSDTVHSIGIFLNLFRQTWFVFEEQT